jgi:hypothetical protein
VFWIFWVLEIPCYTILCWTLLVIVWSSAPTCCERSLLTPRMFFIQTWCWCLADIATLCTFLSSDNIFGTH